MIVDASVAVKWMIAELDSEAAIAWIGRQKLFAPHLIHAEVGNAVCKRLRRGQLTEIDGASERLGRLGRLVEIIDETPVVGRALQIAVALDHSYYDCIYAALAEAHSDGLLTADTVFANKLEQSEFTIRVHTLASSDG
jgi:predicted nucleic acid-binding protein